MQGQPFLESNAKKRDCIFAARDRCDETEDRIRCVRTHQFKYIRNFHPELPYMQPNAYKEMMYPGWNLMLELKREGKLTPAQQLFTVDSRPAEELYDLVSDPDELHNLAGDPLYLNSLVELRTTLENWIRETGDQGEIPESREVVDPIKKEMNEWREKEKTKCLNARGL
jgi:uncharacterized sulfatase